MYLTWRSSFHCFQAYTCALVGTEEHLVGLAAIVPTGKPEKHLYKIGPLYATNLDDALKLCTKLIGKVYHEDSEASVAFGFLEGSVGERELGPILKDRLNSRCTFMGVTLFTKPAEQTDMMDYTRCYLPHNNSCHFDA